MVPNMNGFVNRLLENLTILRTFQMPLVQHCTSVLSVKKIAVYLSDSRVSIGSLALVRILGFPLVPWLTGNA